jgi:hypothetical protein
MSFTTNITLIGSSVKEVADHTNGLLSEIEFVYNGGK